MQVSILNGVYSAVGPDFERSYPLNLVPNVEATGISNGYLRSAPGIDLFATARGPDGGGINWNGSLYRVSSTRLYRIDADASVNEIGNVGGSGQASFAYSFDRLIIGRNNNLFYYDATNGLVQVTDVDLGEVIDCLWQDGYTITTDGTSIVVTELDDPTAVDPLKYGSSEADPDSVMGLGSRRGELIVFNKDTTEFFFNAGTTGFPFERNRGAQIDRGIVGTFAKCVFLETYAACGNGRNQQPQIYLVGEGSAATISTREVDRMLAALTEDELATIILEAREGAGVKELYVHLPDQTLVYSRTASELLEQPVWYRLAAGTDGLSPYPARNFVYAYDAWHCGHRDDGRLGKLTDAHDLQWGDSAAWQFDAQLIYSQGKGACCHNLELVGFYGIADPGTEPRAFMSWTDDGVQFSQERAAKLGFSGQRSLRVAWRRNGFFRNWRSYRFRGITGTCAGFSRLEAELEQLNG